MFIYSLFDLLKIEDFFKVSPNIILHIPLDTCFLFSHNQLKYFKDDSRSLSHIPCSYLLEGTDSMSQGFANAIPLIWSSLTTLSFP